MSFRTALPFLLGLALAACGGGNSGPPDETDPTIAFLFPRQASLTDGALLAVAVQADDDRRVSTVRVNGLVATRDPAGVYRVSVPLVPGGNAVTAVVRDGAGNEAETTVAVECVGGVFGNPRGVAHDAAGNRAFVADPARGQVFAVDLATGAIAKIAAFEWDNPVAVAVDGDTLYVADGGVVVVDLAANTAVRLGPDLIAPTGIAVDSDGRRCLLTDSVERVVVAIDLDTGERTNLAANLNGPNGLVFANGVIYVANGFDVVRVDEATGEVVADVTDGLGSDSGLAGGRIPPLAGIAHDPSGDRLLVSGGNTIRAVALADGAVSLVAGGLDFPQGIAVAGAGVLVADSLRDALVSIVGATVTDVVRSRFGDGPSLASPRDLAGDPAGGILVADFVLGLVSVGADRVIVGGAGPDYVFPIGVASDSTRVVVLDSGVPAVFDVAPASGDAPSSRVQAPRSSRPPVRPSMRAGAALS